MTNYLERLPIPARGSINSGLTYCRPSTALGIFGMPGRLTDQCGPATSPRLVRALETRSVGPFRATGCRPALDSLNRIFTRVKQDDPALYALIGTAGMLCVRSIRGAPGTPSNHSFGLALDVTIGGQLVPLSAPYIQRGLLLLYRYFHAEGWFWGAAWDRPDAMHFEVADETVRAWAAQGLL